MKSFSKLSEVATCRTVLIAGQQGRGKTYNILNDIKSTNTDSDILWLSTNNVRGLAENATDNFYHCDIPDWNTFDNAHNLVVKDKSIYSAIVIDTIDDLFRCALNNARSNNNPVGILTQSDYLLCAETIIVRLKTLSKFTKSLYCSVNIVKDRDGNLVLSLNRDFYNKLLPLFNDRWVCVSKTAKGVTNYDLVKDLTKMSAYSPS